MAVEPWPPYVLSLLFIIVGVVFTAAFFLFASPPGHRPTNPVHAVRLTTHRLGQDRLLGLLALAALIGHAFQVNVLNVITREWWLETTGVDFAGILYAIEGDFVPSLSAIHWGPLVFVMFWFYLVLHNTFVLVAPLFLAYTGERRIARRLLVSYAAIWLLALPGFTFFPATNPTVYLGLDSVLDQVIPGTSEVFYRGTTVDNTIPSLHVGLATLIMLHGVHAKNPRYRWSVVVYAPAVAFSIIYMQVHWALDILAGAIVATLAYWAGCTLERRIQPAGDEYPSLPAKRPRENPETGG